LKKYEEILPDLSFLAMTATPAVAIVCFSNKLSKKIQQTNYKQE
jgi:hypothetical protein